MRKTWCKKKKNMNNNRPTECYGKWYTLRFRFAKFISKNIWVLDLINTWLTNKILHTTLHTAQSAAVSLFL